MKKVIILGIASALSTLLLVGCGAAAKGPEAHTAEMHNKNLTQEKVHKIIKEAGEENGWKMTEFKSNAMIAEKIDNGSSVSTTVTFSKSSFDISPENSELESILSAKLK